MYILGLNAYHGDSSACILKDGKLIAATEEERIRRIKHWAGFPIEAIKFCLKEAGISIEEVDYITISRDPSANLQKKILHTIKKGVSLNTLVSRFTNSRKVSNVKEELSNALTIPTSKIKAEVKNIEHHRSHLASAFFVSPFEEAALLSIDGFGDFTSTMTGTGKDNQISVLDTVIYPHSLGIFYTSFTQYLGFDKYGDEYKVMGLAPYGEPTYLKELEDVIHLLPNGLFELNTAYFKHAKEGVTMAWESGYPTIESIFSDKMVEKFGKLRTKEEELTQDHINLATSVQRMTEKVIFHILNHLHKKTGLDNLCVAGGVAQNSVANGKILENTPFKKVYVPSAGHDAGTALGSALFFYNHELKKPRLEPIWHAYTGSNFSDAEMETILKHQKATTEIAKDIQYSVLSDDELYKTVTDEILDAGVIGWFQGSAEFGPRALGNRSILVDPRRTDAKELLNEKIKRRESFRPFAPSILEEYVEEYFEGADKVPFMEKVYPIKKEKHSVIPAVTHVDGTGRLQTVSASTNPRYHKLIDTFREKTGVPVLLNTSFNENEPIVNTPQEALDCFLRTKMDILVLGNIVVRRK